MAQRLSDIEKWVLEDLNELKDRAGYRSMNALAVAAGYKGPSSIQRYFTPEGLQDGYLPIKFLKKIEHALVGKGEPPIKRSELYSLAGVLFAEDGEVDQVAMETVFNTGMDQIRDLHRPKLPDDLRFVHILGTVQAGAFVEALDDSALGTLPVVGELAKFKNVFSLKVAGDSMDQLYPEGTHLLCQALEDYPFQLENGKNVIVKRRGAGDLFEATVKQIEFGSEETKLVPLSNNPIHKPIVVPRGADDDYHHAGQDDVTIWAVVIGSWRSEV